MEPSLLFHSSPNTRSSLITISLFFITTLSLVAATTFALRNYLGPQYPYSAGEVLQEKLEHLSAHSNEYQIFFLGTSRVYRGINPEVIDSSLEASGYDINSYNAGVFRLSTLAADKLIDAIVTKREPGKPFLIVIEPSFVDFDLPNLSSEREINLHGYKETINAISLETSHLGYPQSVADRCRSIAVILGHLSSGSLHLLNYGRFARTIYPKIDNESRTYAAPQDNGFLALENETISPERGWHGTRDAVETKFREMQANGRQERKAWNKSPRPSAISYYESLLSRISLSGGKSLFICTPRFTVGSYVAGDDIESLLKTPPPYLDSNLLADYRLDSDQSIPGIFTSNYWFDREHLNGSGADLLSKQIAADLLLQRGRTMDHLVKVSRK